MANEFKIKNGLVVDTGGIDVTGSVSISGSLLVGVGNITEFQVLPTGVAIGNIITDIHSVTGSLRISGSLNATSSHAITASYVLNAVSSSFATSALTASHALTSPYSGLQGTIPTWNQNTTGNAATATTAATASSADNFTVRGTLTAQTINAQTITSSIEFVTGSTRNGSITANTHQFTGSVSISGSLAVIAGVTNQLTASHVLTAPYSGLQGTVPTWNQSTTGTAATASYILGSGVAGNISGNAATATQTITTVTGTNSAELVRGNMADNDQFRILVGATATNAGFVEIATADDGTEPIHVRQYTGVFTTLQRTATLLDGSGNTLFPGNVTAVGFFESSDKNIKTLITDNYQAKGIESVVSRLYYKNGRQELGYFAQDVQSILPSAVNVGEDGLLNLSYREVHTAKIAQLEQKVAQLEAQLSK